MNGQIRAIFSQTSLQNGGDAKFDFLLFEARSHEQYLPRSQVMELCTAAAASPNLRSPKMTKNAGPKKGAAKQVEPSKLVPDSPAGALGLSDQIQLWLEVCLE